MADPPEVIISDPADWRNGDTAKASAEVNFEGQVQAIHVDYMGSGYDKLQEYTGTLKFSEFSNLLGIQNIANSSFEKDFLRNLSSEATCSEEKSFMINSVLKDPKVMTGNTP